MRNYILGSIHLDACRQHSVFEQYLLKAMLSFFFSRYSSELTQFSQGGFSWMIIPSSLVCPVGLSLIKSAYEWAFLCVLALIEISISNQDQARVTSTCMHALPGFTRILSNKGSFINQQLIKLSAPRARSKVSKKPWIDTMP